MYERFEFVDYSSIPDADGTSFFDHRFVPIMLRCHVMKKAVLAGRQMKYWKSPRLEGSKDQGQFLFGEAIDQGRILRAVGSDSVSGRVSPDFTTQIASEDFSFASNSHTAKCDPFFRGWCYGNSVASDSRQGIIGPRTGKKLHAQVDWAGNASHVSEYHRDYKIRLAVHNWCSGPDRFKDDVRVSTGFADVSGTNSDWLIETDLAAGTGPYAASIGAI